MKICRIRKAKVSLTVLCVGAFVFVILVASLFPHSASDDNKELCWPSPPATARIRFVRSISSARDLKLKQSSCFKRIVRKIVGLDDTDGVLFSPYGVVTDSRNRIIVADSKSRLIHVFDPQEKKYFTIKQPNGEMFISLIGLAVDLDDNLYVSDSYTGKIFVFDKDGKFTRRLGPDEGQFDRPTGIAIDKARGHLYVVETRKGQVEVLTLSGKELFRFGKRGSADGQLNFPTEICLKGDRVYVTDTLNGRVQVFDMDGKFISKVGRLGDAPGDLDKPKGVAVDSDGHIYVVESLYDLVNIFDADGHLLLTFGGTGSRRGEFFLPAAITIDNDDNIYVSDPYNHRVQMFKYLKSVGSAGE